MFASRVILSYLVGAYAKDDTLYPRDNRMRALVDQRLHFDLGTLAARANDYFVSSSTNFIEKKKTHKIHIDIHTIYILRKKKMFKMRFLFLLFLNSFQHFILVYWMKPKRQN